MKIKVPVPVKMVVTERLKKDLLGDMKESIQELKIELEQLQFQQKKLLAEAKKKGKESLQLVQERIRMEQRKRKEKLDQLYIQVEQVEKLEEGEELLKNTVEAEMEIEIGQSWDEIYYSQEIVIKDGVIIEIRKGKSNWTSDL